MKLLLISLSGWLAYCAIVGLGVYVLAAWLIQGQGTLP